MKVSQIESKERSTRFRMGKRELFGQNVNGRWSRPWRPLYRVMSGPCAAVCIDDSPATLVAITRRCAVGGGTGDSCKNIACLTDEPIS